MTSHSLSSDVVARARTILATALIAAIVAAVAPASTVHAQAPWKNVKISAGSGFVTGIVAQPSVRGLFYLRTDVGGFFRWDVASGAWIPISDFLTIQQRGDYGGEAIAADPNSPNTVYIACGGQDSGVIYKSNDRGETWTRLGLKGVFMAGNDNMRWGGERLAIRPGDSNIMLFGSRTQGLWRSTDAGATWRQNSLPYPEANESGVQAVAFDPNSSNTVYAAVAQEGVFRSADSGATWTNISNTITRPERLVVAPDGVVWVTYARGVSKFANGRWTDCTPREETANAYCGIAVNPRHPNNVIVNCGMWGDPDPPAMFETTNAGATWTKLAPIVKTDVPWYHAMDPGKLPGTIAPFLYTPIANFAFDPNNVSSVWFVGAGGIYHTSDISRKGGPIFHHTENGHEELCVTALATPPRGPELIAGTGDVDGFVFDKGINAYPSRTFVSIGAKSGVTVSIAYEASHPRSMVRISAAQSPWSWPAIVGTSNDGGYVWTQDKSFPTMAPSGRKAVLAPLAVAMSATSASDIVACVADTGNHMAQWFYRKRGMARWSRCSGLPIVEAPQLQAVPLVADPIEGGTFYVYCGGAVYRSVDGGSSFTQMSAGSVGADGAAGFAKLAAQPGIAGNLWLSEDSDNPDYLSLKRSAWEGLYHSTNAGRTWVKVPDVTRAVTFCFGKASASGRPTLYYYGRLNRDHTDRVFRSTNLGRSWTNIQHPGQAMGDGPWLMEGSRQTYGRVFIGTSGRGIFYSPAQ